MIQPVEVYVQNEIEIMLDAHHGVTQTPFTGGFYEREFVIQSTTPYELVKIWLWVENDYDGAEYMVEWKWGSEKARSGVFRLSFESWLTALQTLFEAVFETQRGDHL